MPETLEQTPEQAAQVAQEPAAPAQIPPQDAPGVEPGLKTETKVVKPRGPYKKRPKDDAPESGAAQGQEGGNEEPPKMEVHNLWSPKQEKAAREAGRKAILMLINFPGLYNPDLIPKEQAEQAAAMAFMEAGGEYFVSQKLGDLPPGMALAMAGLGYYVTLLAAERNKGFLKSSWAKIKGAWAWWRAKRSVK